MISFVHTQNLSKKKNASSPGAGLPTCYPFMRLVSATLFVLCFFLTKQPLPGAARLGLPGLGVPTRTGFRFFRCLRNKGTTSWGYFCKGRAAQPCSMPVSATRLGHPISAIPPPAKTTPSRGAFRQRIPLPVSAANLSHTVSARLHPAETVPVPPRGTWR